MSFEKLCEELENDIIEAYNDGVTAEKAERLAARFLSAQLQVSSRLQELDLDSRMRKSGLKAVKAAVYMEACSKADRKPSDVLLEHTINMNDLVGKEQDAFDRAEVARDGLERYYNVFGNAHIFFRNVSKGTFGG